MPKTWKTYNLGKIATLQRGFDLPTKKRVDGNVPIVAASGIGGYHNQAKVKGPGVITGRSGTIGKVMFQKDDFWPLNTSLWVKDFHGNDIKFIYYLLSNFDFSGFNNGTSVPTLNRNDVHGVELTIPPLKEQKAIASILSALDDKIELNLQMNKTLEEMAESLFEQWFFEEAKEEWETFKLENLIEIKGGFSYKGKYIGEGDSLLLGMGCVSFSDRFLQSGARKYSGECNANHLVEPGDLVIATRQQSDNMPILGAPASIPNSLQGKKVIVGTNLYRVNNVSFFRNNLLFQLLRSSAYQNHIKANSKGTTVRMITKDAVELFEFQIPPKSLLEEYDREITALSEQIEHNNLENQTLTKLRDTLLPKLISGEVRVKDVEKTLNEVI